MKFIKFLKKRRDLKFFLPQISLGYHRKAGKFWYNYFVFEIDDVTFNKFGQLPTKLALIKLSKIAEGFRNVIKSSEDRNVI